MASDGPGRAHLASPGHLQPPHTPWGQCVRLGWLVVTYCGHPQPFRRPRALRWRRLVAVRGGSAGFLWVTLVTTTGTRGVGRGHVTYTRAIMHSGLVVMHEFQKKSKKPVNLPSYHRSGLKNKSVTPDKGIKSTKGEEKACKREEEGPKKVFIVHW